MSPARISADRPRAAPSIIRVDQARTAKDPASKEPSMEEILASIRKIVADDVPPAKAAARAAAARPAEPAAQPAATRTQKAQPAPASAEAARNGSGNPDLAKIAALISPAVQAEAAASFDLLNQAVFGKTTRTIEDVVLDLMRPMLQKWLDANLPSLVERLVRQEIERISGHI